MKKVIVSSTNPVKINATKNAFEKMFPEEQFEFEGVKIESGVSDQPMTDEETRRGAISRAQNAKLAVTNADYWVGIEGGVDVHYGEMHTFAWVIILDKNGRKGSEKTATHQLPVKVVELIKQGVELAHADDQIFNRKDSGKQNGSVGLLTSDVVTRTTYYEMAVALALVPFKNSELYF